MTHSHLINVDLTDLEVATAAKAATELGQTLNAFFIDAVHSLCYRLIQEENEMLRAEVTELKQSLLEMKPVESVNTSTVDEDEYVWTPKPGEVVEVYRWMNTATGTFSDASPNLTLIVDSLIEDEGDLYKGYFDCHLPLAPQVGRIIHPLEIRPARGHQS